MAWTKHLIIILTLSILTACSSDGSSPDSSGEYADGSQGTGSGMNSSSIESGNLDSFPAGSQEELAGNIGDRVFFNFNSAKLSSTSQQTLSGQADWLADNSDVTVTIEGHCDERGTREFNIALGEKRATSVRTFLINKGVDASRIKTISYGKEHPEYLGSNEAAWSKNRRGVTVVN